MGLIDDDAVVGVDRRHVGAVLRVEDPLDHALHGRDVEPGVGLDHGLAEFLHVVHVGEGQGALDGHLAEAVLRLVAE